MVLYLEYVLLDNYIMDYLIINLIEKTYKYKIKKLNKIIACAGGSLLVLPLPYIYNNSIILLLYRILIATYMVLVLKRYKNLKQFFTYFILFVAYTFVVGGLIFGIINFFQIEYSMSGILFYSFEFPISIFILAFIFIYNLCKKILIKLNKEKQTSNYLYKLKIYANNNEVDCVGLYDSGNRIEVDGCGVNIISLDVFMKLYNQLKLEKLILKDISSLQLKNPKYININGLKNNGKYLSFIVDKILIEESSFSDVRVAISYKNFNKFDCILSGSLNLK